MFKKSFKYYKSRKPPPNLTQVLDFLKSEDLLCDNKIKKVPLRMTNLDPFFGLKPLDTWEVYEIVAMPGLLFVKNPFTNLGQRYWTVRCLRDYTKRPNKSNLDPFNKPEDTKNWWDICQNGNKLLLDKMRWVTLGYHHNWDTKVYTENNRGQFPTDLKHMTEFLAKVLGFEQFSAQAAIVNFYHLNSTLSGHTDHSERNLNAPLFSLSFGQKAIFLIGGQQLEDQAIPLFLHSGDILVMSKDSRLNYHGVPKILQGDVSEWSSPESESVPNEYDDVVKVCKDNSAWKPFGDYLKHSRINVNVRQVLFDGEIQLSEEINMSGEIVVPETPNWLKDLEEKREKRIKARLGHEAGAGAPCLKCGTDCPGLDLHFWRKACKICRCPKEEHDVHDDDIYGWAQFQLLGSKPNKIKTKIVLPGKNDEVELEWAPKGQKDTVDKYLKTLAPENLPVKGSQAAQNRKQLLQKQIPIHDIDPSLCHELNEDEVSKMEEYIAHIKNSSVGVGQLVNLSNIIRGNLHNISPEEAHIIAAKYSKGVPINEIVKLQSDLAHTLEKIAINSPKGLRQMQPTKPFVNTEENVVNVTPSSKYKDITHPWYANSSPNSRLLNSQCAENLTQNNRTPSNYEIDERLLKGTNFNPSLTPGQFISNRPTVNANRPLENQNIGQPSFSQHLKENKTQQYGFENPYFNRKPVMQNLEQLQNYKIQDESQEQETPKNVKDLIYSTYDIRQGPVQKDLELEHKNLVNTLPNFDSNILPNTYKHDPSVIQHEHRLGITNEKSQNYDPVTEKSLVGDFGFESPSMNLSGNNRKPLTSFSPNNLHINEESVNPQQLNIGGIRDLKPDPGNVKLTGSNRKPLSSFTPNRFNVNEESVNPQQMNIGSIKDQTPDSLNKGLSGRNRKPLTSLTPNRFRINEESLNPQQINIGAIQDLEPDIYSGDDLAAYVQDESQSDKSYPPETINEILNNINLPDCHYCKKPFEENEFAVTIDRANALFHAHCFKCAGCNQSLADNIYFYDKESNNIYCGRDYAKIRGYPRCSACDELIFTKEYCLAENSTFHLKHFCCIQCDTPLAGQEYTLEDEKPYCLPCFESTKAAKCGTCEKVIKPDERGCQLNGVHFHAEDDCFRCIVCSLPLMGKKLLLRNEKLYCSHECFNSVKM